jgi:replicative DNA helicase
MKETDSLPVNHDVEVGLIACAMLGPKLWHEMAFVAPDDFVDPFNGKLWALIRAAYERGESPQVQAIGDAAGGTTDERKQITDWLVSWMSRTITVLSGVDYAKMVHDYAERRKIIDLANRIQFEAADVSGARIAADIAAKAVSELTNIVCRKRETLSAFEVGMQVVNNLAKPMDFCSTKFPRLDGALGGGLFQNKFYGIGARMKSGKSLLMSTLAYNMTVMGTSRVLYLCLEMGYEETFQRLLARKMGFNASEFLDPIKRLDKGFRENARTAAATFKDCGLFFKARPRIDIDDLKSIIAQEGLRGHVDGIIIDYLQLVTGKTKSQTLADHYDHVAQTMAEAVKRYPIWILTAAQLNQEGNIRGGEGLLNACDMTFALHKKEFAPDWQGTRVCDEAWLEMMASRYTQYRNIGSEQSAGYRIETQIGPMFCEQQL